MNLHLGGCAWSHQLVLGLSLLLALGASGAERLGPSSRRTGIVISEILYRPARPDGVPFLELYNSQPIPEDLSGWRISGACDFTFPTNTVLAPGAFLVVAPQPERAKSLYRLTNVVGGFTNTLPADTGLVRLRNRTGAILLEVEYASRPPWPTVPEGHSLVLARPSCGESDPRAWAASQNRNGSPGSPEPAAVARADAAPAPRTPWPANRPPVAINEILYHPPSGNDDDQFVELYNYGSNRLSLTNWRLADGVQFEFPAGTMIAPGGYLVVAKNAARLRAQYPRLTNAPVLGNFKGKLAHGGERIALLAGEVLVDELRWFDGGRWGQWADGGGSSLELRDPRGDHRPADHWGDSDETGKSAWSTVEFTGQLIHGDLPSSQRLEIILCGAGECLVDEVQVIYQGENLVRAADSNLDGGPGAWIAEGNHEMSAWQAGGGVGDTGCLCLRASGRGDYFFNRARVNLAKPIPANATATLRAQARWRHGTPDLVLRLTGNFLEAVGRLPRPLCPGTPGAPNSRAVPNVGPAIEAVSHAPILPAANQPVLISARVGDPDGVGKVAVHFRVDGVSAPQSAELVDDGTHGDITARDGIFSATLPGAAAGQLLAFRVIATDPRGLTNDFPHFRPVYPGDTNGPECLVRFGETPRAEGARRFPNYRLWLTRALFERWARRGSAHNAPVSCTFVYDDARVVHDAGVYYSGSYNTRAATSSPLDSMNRSPLAGYNLVLPADEPVLGATEFALDANSRPGFAQHEQAGFWLARELGLPYSHRRYINVVLNGSVRAVFEDVLPPGRDYLRAFYPEDAHGDLFKVEVWWQSADFPLRGSYHAEPPLAPYLRGGQKNLARYRWTFQKRADSGSANDYGAVFALVDALAAPPAQYTDAVERVVDIAQWMRVLAFERLIGNHDSWGRHAPHNLYAYKPQKGRWQLLPFDLDYSFYGGEDPRSDLVNGAFYSDRQLAQLVNHPPFLRAYLRALRDAINGPLARDPRTGRQPKVDAFLDANYEAISVVNQLGGAELSPDYLAPGWQWTLRGWFSNRYDAITATLKRYPNAP